MIDATQETVIAPESDPTLSTLVPQRSIRRNLLLGAAAVVLLVGASFSPQVLRPSVIHDSVGGSSAVLVRQHQVLTVVQLTPEGWPSVGVQSVGDLSGATVAGAWVLADASAGTGAATEPAEHATGLDYLRASYPHGSFGAASRLPHRLGAGESGQLFILWDIVDCSRLVQGQRAQIELTSILGTGTQQELPDWAGPEFALSNTTETGACRTP